MSEEITSMNYENNNLTTATTYPGRKIEIDASGIKYVIGEVPAYTVYNVIPKENLPILLQSLQEQFALQNGPYEEAKKQLAELDKEGFTEQLAKVFENHAKALGSAADKNEMKRIVKKMPAYAELTEKALRRTQLVSRIDFLKENVVRLKTQIEQLIPLIDQASK